MINPFRASRQFERALNIDINAPREDNMNLEELAEHHSTEIQEIPDLGEDAVLIATIVYNPEEKKIEYHYHR